MFLCISMMLQLEEDRERAQKYEEDGAERSQIDDNIPDHRIRQVKPGGSPVSYEAASVHAPSSDTLPCVGLRPTTPQ